jgi:Penicillin amidase.
LIEIEGWYDIGNSSSVKEFEKQLAKRKIPSFRFVTMVYDRNIGYFYNGRIPNRHDAAKARQIRNNCSSMDIWDESDLVNDLLKFIIPSNGRIQSTNQNPFLVMGDYSSDKKSVKSNELFEQRLTEGYYVAHDLLSKEESMGANQIRSLNSPHPNSNTSGEYMLPYQSNSNTLCYLP